jgi:hypothetical protein
VFWGALRSWAIVLKVEIFYSALHRSIDFLCGNCVKIWNVGVRQLTFPTKGKGPFRSEVNSDYYEALCQKSWNCASQATIVIAMTFAKI